MTIEKKEIKQGINLHTIVTDKFKTDLVAIFVTVPIKRETVTIDSIVPSVLRRGTNQYNSQEEISKALEDMYGASFDCGIEKIGDNHVIKFYLESISDNFLPNSENVLEKSIDMIMQILLDPLVEDGCFKQEYFESEKNNIRRLIESKIDNKDLYSVDRCIETMYEGKEYGLYKYGYIEDLEKIESVDVYNRYRNIIETAKIDFFVSRKFQ